MPARHYTTQTVATALLMFLAGSVLSGCGADAEADRALQEAETTLASLHSSPGIAPAEYVESTHSTIRRTLGPALADGRETVQAAAKLVEGQTYAGDAELYALAAEALDARAADLQMEAQTLAGRLYVWRHARADATASYSSASSVQEVEGAIAEALSKRAEVVARRDDVQNRIDELMTAMNAQAEEVTSLRTYEAQLRDRSLEEEGDTRLDTIEAVYAAQRAADAAVATTSELNARIANLRPELEEIERQATGNDLLIELLRATKDSLLERGNRSARTAQVDREQASAAAGRLDVLLGEIDEFRTGELAEAYQKAADAFRKAGTSLRTANNGGANPLWLAAAHHGQAELLSSFAASETRYANFLDTLAAVEPLLPFAGELNSRAADARESAETHQRDASASYTAAASQYRKAGRGPQAQKLREIAERLDARASGEEFIPDGLDEG